MISGPKKQDIPISWVPPSKNTVFSIAVPQKRPRKISRRISRRSIPPRLLPWKRRCAVCVRFTPEERKTARWAAKQMGYKTLQEGIRNVFCNRSIIQKYRAGKPQTTPPLANAITGGIDGFASLICLATGRKDEACRLADKARHEMGQPVKAEDTPTPTAWDEFFKDCPMCRNCLHPVAKCKCEKHG